MWRRLAAMLDFELFSLDPELVRMNCQIHCRRGPLTSDNRWRSAPQTGVVDLISRRSISIYDWVVMILSDVCSTINSSERVKPVKTGS